MDKNSQDIRATTLSLGLGVGPTTTTSAEHLRPREPCSPLTNLTSDQPSLTLSLSTDAYAETGKAKEESRPAPASSCRSAVSSFSSPHATIFMREKDVGSDEAEEDEDEEDNGCARKKLRLTKEQSAMLENRFKEHTSLNPKQKQALAKQLNLRPRQVEVWFQNRRARTKLKQTEVDCELLRRCYEKLTAENQRLRKELQEMKSLRFAASSPLYMQLPAATLALCPSCQRINGSEAGSDAASKPGLFLNPFTHPAPC
ncbi:hypothetical protein OPV22_017602 [Ensete ventricosum]|uniref:Homeobox domain-containing protein n=1 Tax=Ensete ventricosum TaxID=4639 RepID=A0AAV8QSG3_ENSVE|nr:hypothetical protein OPV22_017602 [Ensete ventricosum]